MCSESKPVNKIIIYYIIIYYYIIYNNLNRTNYAMLLLIANPNDSPMRRFADAPWLAKSGEKIWRFAIFLLLLYANYILP